MLLKLSAIMLLWASLAACSPLSVLNTFTPGSQAQIAGGLAYGTAPRQKLDIYTPAASSGLAPAGLAPVIVFFYGGSWNSGSREDYAFVGHSLAKRGMVTVVADYRLYPQVHYPQILDDAAHAVAWTLRNIGKHGGDPGQVFVMGHSAGAYNAAMVALDRRWLAAYGMAPSALRGWIGLAGPYDFLPIQNPDVKPVFFHPDTPPQSQPINHVEPGAVPALLIAAKDDSVVNPIRNTGGLANKLRLNRVPVEEIYFDGVGHATLVATLSASLAHLAPTLDAVERFVLAHGKAENRLAQPISKNHQLVEETDNSATLLK